MRMLNPPHPGAFVKTAVIEPLGLTVAAARVLGVSRPALSTFLNGRADLSGMMALRIEKAFGVKTDTLMRLQSSYDIARTRGREGSWTSRRIGRRCLRGRRARECSANLTGCNGSWYTGCRWRSTANQSHRAMKADN